MLNRFYFQIVLADIATKAVKQQKCRSASTLRQFGMGM
jgi:hypothetical protein